MPLQWKVCFREHISEVNGKYYTDYFTEEHFFLAKSFRDESGGMSTGNITKLWISSALVIKLKILELEVF